MCFISLTHRAEGESLAVQSMDGQLAVFEQDRAAFTRQLPDSLLPGPMCYVPSIDAFAVLGTENKLRAFKYSVLAAATSSLPQHRRPRAESQAAGGGEGGEAGGGRDGTDGGAGVGKGGGSGGLGAGRRVTSEWSINLGEPCLSVQVARLSETASA